MVIFVYCYAIVLGHIVVFACPPFCQSLSSIQCSFFTPNKKV